jgi:superfamily II DNA/RNA helicase
MLDMGFKPAVDRIVSGTPDRRQTLFFSATLEGATGKVAKAYTRDARRHTQAAGERGDAEIVHRFLHVDSPSEKLEPLVKQLRDQESGRTLVFVRTKRGADRLAKRLKAQGISTAAMHGDKTQSQREKALARFEAGNIDALIATDVAARGIDVADVTHVINYDVPGDRESYVHRVGRTGRAGATGTGISLVLADQADEVRRMAGDLGLTREFDHGRTSISTNTSRPTASQSRPRRNRRRARSAR